MSTCMHKSLTIPPTILHILRGRSRALDPDAEKMITVLKDSAASEIWHKHGSFYDHLHDVWEAMSVWNQPQAWCRLGLFHSAYSNSFVSMGLYDAATDRPKLRALIGADAENLVYKFCVIDRKHLEEMVITESEIRKLGYEMQHIRNAEDTVSVSCEEATAMIMETMADYMDQSFG